MDRSYLIASICLKIVSHPRSYKSVMCDSFNSRILQNLLNCVQHSTSFSLTFRYCKNCSIWYIDFINVSNFFETRLQWLIKDYCSKYKRLLPNSTLITHTLTCQESGEREANVALYCPKVPISHTFLKYQLKLTIHSISNYSTSLAIDDTHWFLNFQAAYDEPKVRKLVCGFFFLLHSFS